MTENTGIIVTASGRSLEEVKAGIRIRMRSMVNSALEIGMDLIEAKEACRHGEWMPFLKDLGFSASSAGNYMRIAREVSADSRMAQLPYTKILALMAAPAEDREELAAMADDMSAAEIRRLTDERNRAAEAANAETARADQAEQDAKRFYDENASLRTELENANARLEREKVKSYNEGHKVGQKVAWDSIGEEMRDENRELQKQVQDLKEELEQKQADLLIAENNRVEVVPADYEELKRRQTELIDAAAEAEERAAAAEEQLALLSCRPEEKEEPWKVIKVAMTRFMADCEMLALNPAALARDQARIEAYLSRLEAWADQMRIAMAKVTPEAEGAVV